MKKTDVNTGEILVDIISAAIQLPGVKVNRKTFLLEQFKDAPPEIKEIILARGPIKAKCSRDKLKRRAEKIVNDRTLISSGASFAAGMPGGLAMAATIPADTLQFYAVVLRMAQEIAYLYGEDDLWAEETLDMEKVTNQLILYCGVMLKVAGAAQTLRIISSPLAKRIMKKLPQKTMTKTLYYAVVKSIVKTVGTNMTKSVFSKGAAKIVPVIGGVVSGGMTMLTMKPMGMRLVEALDKAHYAYTQFDFDSDWNALVKECNDAVEAMDKQQTANPNVTQASASTSPVFEELKQAKKMVEEGILSEEEFAEIKAKLIAKL